MKNMLGVDFRRVRFSKIHKVAMCVSWVASCHTHLRQAGTKPARRGWVASCHTHLARLAQIQPGEDGLAACADRIF